MFDYTCVLTCASSWLIKGLRGGYVVTSAKEAENTEDSRGEVEQLIGLRGREVGQTELTDRHGWGPQKETSIVDSPSLLIVGERKWV